MDAAPKWVTMETKMAPYPGQFWITAPREYRVSQKVFITHSMVYLSIAITRQFSTYLEWCSDSLSFTYLDHLRVWSLPLSKEVVLSEKVSLMQYVEIWMNGRARKFYISFIFYSKAGDEIFGNFISIILLHFYLLKARLSWREYGQRISALLETFPHWNVHRGKYNNWP